MSSEEIAISVDDLGKCYQVYDRPRDRLLQMLCRGRRRYYREFWALRGVSLTIRRGETIGIIGRNGSGKSTLLQLICGTLNPTTGGIRIAGRVAALLELGAGFNPEFTGRENVQLVATLHGLTPEQISSRFDRIAAFADIGEHIDQPVKTYSSGMYVRLAFAVIAHVDADILVIDEALAVGDAFFTQKCMRFLRDFMRRGTVLFVSHDTAAVQNLCDRAVWLANGEMAFLGTPKRAAQLYLEDLYESVQGPGGGEQLPSPGVAPESEPEYRDMRLDFINASPCRNDIEIFRFDPDATSFGKGGVKVVSVVLADSTGARLSWVVGGEDVRVVVTCATMQPVFSPIVGFQVRDRLGQVLFGDNTYLTYRTAPLRIEGGGRFTATFDFRLPVLPVGDYSIEVAVAEGTQEKHVQHHWMHDALKFRSQASSVCFGLLGLPMRSIRMQVDSQVVTDLPGVKSTPPHPEP